MINDLGLNQQLVEQALYITRVVDLDMWNPAYRRVYYGSEFCEGLIPEIHDLRAVVEFIQKKKLYFSFVTCPVSNKGIERFEKITHYFYKEIKEQCFEVVLNDWGLLDVFKNLNCHFSLGRLLVKQKCDPRAVNFLPKLTEEARSSLRSISINEKITDFMKLKNILRLEIDNLPQGLMVGDIHGMALSLYIPFGYITTSRVCHYSSARVHPSSNFIYYSNCQKDCQKGKFALKNPCFSGEVYMRGNTLFFKNEKIPYSLLGNVIDRIVFEPRIPL